TIVRFCVPTIQAPRSAPLNSLALARGCRALVAVSLVAGVSRAARAQESLIERLNLDKLQIVSLGASIGRVFPSQVNPTTIYAISADYGEIARSWRVNFTSSYWSSKYRTAVVNAFVDSLNKQLNDPSG